MKSFAFFVCFIIQALLSKKITIHLPIKDFIENKGHDYHLKLMSSDNVFARKSAVIISCKKIKLRIFSGNGVFRLYTFKKTSDADLQVKMTEHFDLGGRVGWMGFFPNIFSFNKRSSTLFCQKKIKKTDNFLYQGGCFFIKIVFWIKKNRASVGNFIREILRHCDSYSDKPVCDPVWLWRYFIIGSDVFMRDFIKL